MRGYWSFSGPPCTSVVQWRFPAIVSNFSATPSLSVVFPRAGAVFQQIGCKFTCSADFLSAEFGIFFTIIPTASTESPLSSSCRTVCE